MSKNKQCYDYRKIFGSMKNKPEYSNYETDIDKVFKMSDITQEVLNGTININGSEKDPYYMITWSCLSKEIKIQKVIQYCEKLETTEQNAKNIKSELIYLISKKKLNKNEHVNYNAETQKIENIPSVVYDKKTGSYYMEIINDKVSLKGSILSNNMHKVS